MKVSEVAGLSFAKGISFIERASVRILCTTRSATRKKLIGIAVHPPHFTYEALKPLILSSTLCHEVVNFTTQGALEGPSENQEMDVYVQFWVSDAYKTCIHRFNKYDNLTFTF